MEIEMGDLTSVTKNVVNTFFTSSEIILPTASIITTTPALSDFSLPISLARDLSFSPSPSLGIKKVISKVDKMGNDQQEIGGCSAKLTNLEVTLTASKLRSLNRGIDQVSMLLNMLSSYNGAITIMTRYVDPRYVITTPVRQLVHEAQTYQYLSTSRNVITATGVSVTNVTTKPLFLKIAHTVFGITAMACVGAIYHFKEQQRQLVEN